MDRKRWFLAGTVPRAPLIAAGALCGVSTQSHTAAYAIVLLVPLLWVWSQNRVTATVVLAAYYAAASWPTVHAINDYTPYDSQYAGWGWLAWGIVVFLSVLPWALLYRQDDAWLFSRLSLIAAITVLPPIGLFQHAWPFLGAAWLMPGFGLLAIVVTIAATTCIARRPLLAFAALLLPLLWFPYPPAQAETAKTWAPFDTQVPMGTTTLDFRAAYHELRAFGRHAKALADQGTSNFVLPESLAGFNPQMAAYAIGRPTGAVVYVGGLEPQANGTMRSVFFAYSDRSPLGQIVYRQRTPIPLLSGESTQLVTPTTVVLDGHRLGFLICFEGFNAWAPFSAMIRKPDHVIVAANFAFLSQAELVNRMYRAHLGAWSRLFAVPLTISVNSPPVSG